MVDRNAYTTEESEFLRAIDTYKRVNRRPFPTWSEILSIAKSLGYRKIAECTELPTYNRYINQYNLKIKDSEVDDNDRQYDGEECDREPSE